MAERTVWMKVGDGKPRPFSGPLDVRPDQLVDSLAGDDAFGNAVRALRRDGWGVHVVPSFATAPAVENEVPFDSKVSTHTGAGDVFIVLHQAGSIEGAGDPTSAFVSALERVADLVLRKQQAEAPAAPKAGGGKVAHMSAGNTTVYQAAKGKRKADTVILKVADIAAAPAAEFTRYTWCPINPAQLLSENQASTGVLKLGSPPDPRVLPLHCHLQALLPTDLTAFVHAFDVRSAVLDLPLPDDDGGVTRVTGHSDAALGLLSTAGVEPLDKTVCLFVWKRPGYEKMVWDGKFTRQALLQMMAFERQYHRPVVVVVTDLHSTLRVFASEYEGGDEEHNFQFTFGDILEYRAPCRAELELPAHWGWLCHFLQQKAVEVFSLFQRLPTVRFVLPPVGEDDDEDGGGDDDVVSEGSRSIRDGGADETAPGGPRKGMATGGPPGAGSEPVSRARGGPSTISLHIGLCDENSPPPMDSSTSSNIERGLKALRLKQWVGLTSLG